MLDQTKRCESDIAIFEITLTASISNLYLLRHLMYEMVYKKPAFWIKFKMAAYLAHSVNICFTNGSSPSLSRVLCIVLLTADSEEKSLVTKKL